MITLLLQIAFSIMVSIIAMHVIGVLLRNLRTAFRPPLSRGIYAMSGLLAFVVAMHGVSHVALLQ